MPKSEPAVRIVPKRNSLLIFQVSVNSFHRVEQLYCPKGRMSIGGWFHGPPVAYPTTFSLPDPFTLAPFPTQDRGEELLAEWINPVYLQEDSQQQIQQQFEQDSQISLQQFLRPELFQRLRDFVLAKPEQEWSTQSPPHQRYYKAAPFEPKEESVLGHFARLLVCPAFLALMKRLTDLDLSQYFAELQQFGNGHFTLMHDGDSRRKREGLDCMFYLIEESLDWDEGWGAYTSYNGDEGELLTVTPCGNTLSLVFCDEGISRFTKFVNYHVPCPMYNVYMLAYEAEAPSP